MHVASSCMSSAGARCKFGSRDEIFGPGVGVFCFWCSFKSNWPFIASIKLQVWPTSSSPFQCCFTWACGCLFSRWNRRAQRAVTALVTSVDLGSGGSCEISCLGTAKAHHSGPSSHLSSCLLSLRLESEEQRKLTLGLCSALLLILIQGLGVGAQVGSPSTYWFLNAHLLMK